MLQKTRKNLDAEKVVCLGKKMGLFEILLIWHIYLPK